MNPYLLGLHKKKNLILIGGGHSHVTVIQQLAKKPESGLQITLVSENAYTPYSGMLPGLIAGHYSFDDCHIDLRRLCQWAGIRFICSTVKQLDPEEKKIICHQHPSLSYDLLSINTGSRPRQQTIDGALQHGCAVKPINIFLNHWRQWLNSATAKNQTYHIVMIGGGAAGVEVLLAIHYHLYNTSNIRADFTLITSDKSILSAHNTHVQNFFSQHLKRLGIKIISNQKVTAITPHQLLLANGQILTVDFATLAIDAGAQPWLAESGLLCDNKGFIQVNQYLRSISHPDIFAVGDCAAFTPSPLPKAGVYAVRQGPILTNNLIATLTGRSLRPFKPQHRFLSILATGGRHAVASRGALFAAGKWVWYWKNHIDRKFMARFNPTTKDRQEQ
ncbi:MAG: pyridine nucleotide-disulfide oxidoreductase [Nitrosomonas sp.]|nr:MAG: pyridine nucleotide-disulfide oxidoreductase [Nitrosomonas sp.]